MRIMERKFLVTVEKERKKENLKRSEQKKVERKTKEGERR